MSNFNCPKCGTAIIDSPRGYITSCEHHKAEDINKLMSKHLEGDCHCHGGFICNVCASEIISNVDYLAKCQVGIPAEFRSVVKELASNNFEVNKQGNINGKD